MTPLRQRMIDDMRMRNLAKLTQRNYVRAVVQLAQHFRTSPDQLDREQVREYLLYLVKERHVAPNTYNVVHSGLKFFYQVTLGRDWAMENLVCAKSEKRLPVVLSREEVAQLLNARHRLKTHTMLMTCYATGVRVGHRSLQTTAVYTHVSAGTIHAAMRCTRVMSSASYDRSLSDRPLERIILKSM